MPTVRELRQDAKELGLKQYSRLTKPELEQYLFIMRCKLWEQHIYDLGGNAITVKMQAEAPINIDDEIQILDK
jgi:hypothetical protein